MCTILIKLKSVKTDNLFKTKQASVVSILHVLGILIKCYTMRYMYSKYITVNDMSVVMHTFDDVDNFFFCILNFILKASLHFDLYFIFLYSSV